MRLDEVATALQAEVRKDHLRRAVILDVENVEITGDIRFDHEAHGISCSELTRGTGPDRRIARASPEERTSKSDRPRGSRWCRSPRLRLMGDDLITSTHEAADHLGI